MRPAHTRSEANNTKIYRLNLKIVTQIKLICGFLIIFSASLEPIGTPLFRISGARVRERHGGVREELVWGKGSAWFRCLGDTDKLELSVTIRLKEAFTDRWTALEIGPPFLFPIRSRVLSTDQHEQHLYPGTSHEREGERLI